MSAAVQSPALNLEREHIETMCALTLPPAPPAAAAHYVEQLSPDEREHFLGLADSNHVIIRSLAPVLQRATSDTTRTWIAEKIAAEQRRIAHALEKLNQICTELEHAGCPVTVIKTLEHWPDLGSDLDLYSTADERAIVNVMVSRFDAHIESRSWGDRLAHKWNFGVPGLKESVEVHVRRLGQTGEHTLLAERFVRRRVPLVVSGHTFFVPAPEERVIVATLQRMYRHLYFRVCDVVNTAALVESGTLNYDELRRVANFGGIWPGVATYLNIMSDYVEHYRGQSLPLPPSVKSAAHFGGEKITVRLRFLRVPVMPEGARLYTEQVTSTALRGDVPATFRLTLLPPLASAAAIAFRFTGSDKGIW